MQLSVMTELQSNNSFWLFYFWKAEYLGRKKSCSMTCGAIVDKGCNVAQSVIQSCHQSSMFRENGRETLPFHKYKAFVYDDCASHEAFFLLSKISMPYYISVQTWTPFTNIRNIFYSMFYLHQTADERIIWYSRILQKLYNTSRYRRNLKRKETGLLKWLHIGLYKEQLKWKGSEDQYFPLDAVMLDSRPMTGQVFPP